MGHNHVQGPSLTKWHVIIYISVLIPIFLNNFINNLYKIIYMKSVLKLIAFLALTHSAMGVLKASGDHKLSINCPFDEYNSHFWDVTKIS